MATLKNTTINDTANLTLPAGTTAQRPGSPSAGMIRYNTTIEDTEFYDGTAWSPISDSNPEATGGTVVDTDIGGVPYRIHLFTNTGNSTFTVSKGGEVEYLIVAGGGGGGNGAAGAAGGGGGGGGGGLLTGFTTVTPQAYTITVGTGGNPGTNGTNSSAFGLTSVGGGAGGTGQPSGQAEAGSNGGSGGGSGSTNGSGTTNVGGSGTPGQGNDGGDCTSVRLAGGGGGAGNPGKDGVPGKAGDGGNGILSSITGTNQFYAGGGGGGVGAGGPPGAGGLGGGGAGGPDNLNGSPGSLNTGGGSGGAGDGGSITFPGGSGIVVIRYPRNASTQTSPSRTVVATQPEIYRTVRDSLLLELDAAFPPANFSTGNVWKDISKTGNDGILFDTPGFNTTDGASITLNGSTQYINIPFNNAMNSDYITIEYFVKPQQQTHVRPFVNRADQNGGPGVAPWRLLMQNPSGSAFGVNVVIGGTTRVVASTTLFNTSQFYHVVATYDGAELSLFINGVKESSLSVTGVIDKTTNPIQIGRNAGYSPNRFAAQHSGILRIYTRALTQAEILQNFNANRGRYGI